MRAKGVVLAAAVLLSLHCSPPRTHDRLILRNSRGGDISTTTDPEPVLVMDAEGLASTAPDRVNVVDVSGRLISSAPVTLLRDVAVSSVARPLPCGQYIARLESGGAVIREFSLLRNGCETHVSGTW